MAVKRVNKSVLGALEKPTLAWMAARLPTWVLPNHLTLLGFLGAVLAACGFVLSRWSISWLGLSSLGLALNWFGDSLDGTLARLRRIERARFGFFVDHTCDLFAQTIIFLSVGVSPCAHFAVGCLGLIAFLIAFVYSLIVAHVGGTMYITYAGFGPTEIRALLIGGNLLVLAFGVIDLHTWLGPLAIAESVTLHDLVISILALAAAAVISGLAIRDASRFATDDPAPPSPLSSHAGTRAAK
jgi:archaetidylinositol phosphate synthase